MSYEKFGKQKAIICDICANVFEPAVFCLKFKIGKEIYHCCDPEDQADGIAIMSKQLCITKFLKEGITQQKYVVYDAIFSRIWLTETDED